MIFLLILLMSALANWQAVETYHHGAIFATVRARYEDRLGFLAELIGCPFCLSHWTAMIFTALAFNSPVVTSGSESWWLVPAFWLATVRLSNVFNDLTHAVCRTPRIDKELLESTGLLNGTADNPRYPDTPTKT